MKYIIKEMHNCLGKYIIKEMHNCLDCPYIEIVTSKKTEKEFLLCMSYEKILPNIKKIIEINFPEWCSVPDANSSVKEELEKKSFTTFNTAVKEL